MKINSVSKQQLFKINTNWQQFIFVTIVILCLFSFITPPIALLLGLLLANLTGNPFENFSSRAVPFLLQFSVVGLGFGMNVTSAISAGKEGFLLTIVSIFSTLLLGILLGKWLMVDTKTAHLIACGTAICGGSAIAAITPIIKSNENQTSVALGVIFILNSVALFLFPFLGNELHLTQKEFGMWCAIAIHDTSSVVGAASKYGTEALHIATTVKLARALWIIPVALLTALIFKNKETKIKFPYFIGLFIIAMLLNSYFSPIHALVPAIVSIAKIGLTITLFLIGSGLNILVLKSVGVKPLLQGVLLWVFIAILALLTILYLV